VTRTAAWSAGRSLTWEFVRCGEQVCVARLDDRMPFEPGNQALQETLWQLYASRVRDALLLAHQPGPADDSVRELDQALGRRQPGFRPVPADQATQFFAALGCQPVTEASFDPILHEIITCQAAADSGAPIQVTGCAWPALMIGELVFTRAGVHVRAGSAHAVPGIADRSTLHWEYWRRHRTTSDGSFWSGPQFAVEDRAAPRLHHRPRPRLRLRRTLGLQPLPAPVAGRR